MNFLFARRKERKGGKMGERVPRPTEENGHIISKDFGSLRGEPCINDRNI